mgnify:CR=1 FL=1
MKNNKKTFRVTRKRIIHENTYIIAKDWEDAERLATEEEQDWEHLDSHDYIDAEDTEEY